MWFKGVDAKSRMAGLGDSVFLVLDNCIGSQNSTLHYKEVGRSRCSLWSVAPDPPSGHTAERAGQVTFRKQASTLSESQPPISPGMMYARPSMTCMSSKTGKGCRATWWNAEVLPRQHCLGEDRH